MTKYKLEDLKVGAVFKNGNEKRAIITVGKEDVIYSYTHREFGCMELCRPILNFLDGSCGKLIVPAIKTKKVKTKKRNKNTGV